jgi:hypothetical protein
MFAAAAGQEQESTPDQQDAVNRAYVKEIERKNLETKQANDKAIRGAKDTLRYDAALAAREAVLSSAYETKEAELRKASNEEILKLRSELASSAYAGQLSGQQYQQQLQLQQMKHQQDLQLKQQMHEQQLNIANGLPSQMQIGYTPPPQNALVPYGVFPPQGPPPSQGAQKGTQPNSNAPANKNTKYFNKLWAIAQSMGKAHPTLGKLCYKSYYKEHPYCLGFKTPNDPNHLKKWVHAKHNSAAGKCSQAGEPGGCLECWKPAGCAFSHELKLF